MSRWLSWGAVVALGFWGTMGLAAQEKPAPAQKPDAEVSPEQATQQLAGYLKQREELGEKLKALQEDFNEANKNQDAKKVQEIRTEFDKLVTEFESKVLPKMVAVAFPLYRKDGKNTDAEQIVLGYLNDLFVQNRYAEVVKEGEPLLAAGRKHPAILNFVGVSYFATHQFDKAKKLLEEAQKMGDDGNGEAARIFASLGGRYLSECDHYSELWAQEQAIRQKEAAAEGDARLPRVLFRTSRGDIELELFENEAPNTVANFVSLVEAKKYDGIAFHRVIPNFMAQGGDPNTLDKDPRNDGQGGPGYRIACECYRKDARMHFAGSLSMAHAGPNTGGSQFFLTHLPTAHLNPKGTAESPGGGHTVFGRVVKGMDVVAAIEPGDRILSAKVLFKRNHPYVPKKLGEE